MFENKLNYATLAVEWAVLCVLSVKNWILSITGTSASAYCVQKKTGIPYDEIDTLNQIAQSYGRTILYAF